MSEPTLQDTYKAMLRDEVAPVLRQLGFRGSGQKFRFRAPDGSTALVVFQKSKWNSDAELEFYVNLSVYPSKWWSFLREDEPWRPQEPDWGHPAPWDGRLEALVGRQSWIARSVAELRALLPGLLAGLNDVVPLMKRYLVDEEVVGFLQRAFEWQPERDEALANGRLPAREASEEFGFAPTDVQRDMCICLLLSDKRDARFDAALARLEQAALRPHPSAPYVRHNVERLKQSRA